MGKNSTIWKALLAQNIKNVKMIGHRLLKMGPLDIILFIFTTESFLSWINYPTSLSLSDFSDEKKISDEKKDKL